jgi:hypothetical protein
MQIVLVKPAASGKGISSLWQLLNLRWAHGSSAFLGNPEIDEIEGQLDAKIDTR